MLGSGSITGELEEEAVPPGAVRGREETDGIRHIQSAADTFVRDEVTRACPWGAAIGPSRADGVSKVMTDLNPSRG